MVEQALQKEHEAMLAEQRAEEERQQAALAREAATTEAARVIGIYIRAFLVRRAAFRAKERRKRRRWETPAVQCKANRTRTVNLRCNTSILASIR